MRSFGFRIVVVVLASLALATLLFGYWPVTVGLVIVVVALALSRALQANDPEPTE